MIKVGFKRLREDSILPVKAHATDSGFDLFASEDAILEPGETKVIKTGIAVHLPEGYEAQVRPRSGVTSKTKLRVQLGTIDNSYTGEIGIIVDNIFETQFDFNSLEDEIETISHHAVKLLNEEIVESDNRNLICTYKVKKGDKLAQLVVQELPTVQAYEIDKLPETVRGTNGFGSSGY